MIKSVDAWLNTVTMYRLTVYVLVGLLAAAAGLSAVRIMGLDPFALLFTAGFLVAACWASNALLARVFGVPANVESSYITALILALIVQPLAGYADLPALALLAVLAMASKYLIAPFRKHVFNPVALAAVLWGLMLDREPTWWLAALPMLPFVAVAGLLVVRKLQRGVMVAAFIAAALAATVVVSLASRGDVLAALGQTVIESPLLFFAFFILTEPITMPPTRPLQIIYGALTGILFAPELHIGPLAFTPEAAMLVGNLFSYAVSAKKKLVLKLARKEHIGADVWDFIFAVDRPLSFAPGQYMEWTLGHPDPDSRGNRRYFTMASSPTESEVRVGVKIPERASSYKRAMLAMEAGSTMVAGQLAGDFTIPRDAAQPLVFIAGGIGITPFRSIIHDLLDRKERRAITLLYSNRTADELAYTDVFERAGREIGLRTIYTLTDPSRAPRGWAGRLGRIDAALIRAEIPDYAGRMFYLSGPNTMVEGFERTLLDMGVSPSRIRKDFFPGFA
ncbi:MAG: hypothetical protein KAX36_09485 [Thermoflexales bacterium]|nr:hypothetical protein [Thermoflexales bacterium]